MFSKSCQYGIKAILYVAQKSLDGNRVKIGDISENIGSPEAFTAKIMSALTKEGIVNSIKGPNGGFAIELNRMKEISISEIVYAIDGDSIYNGCGLGLSECNAQEPCPMHEKFVHIRNDLKQMLKTTSIHDLAYNIKLGKSILLR